MKNGIELIAEERQRQIEKEGWTPEHDDQHTDGELAAAACVYADFANYHADFDLMYGYPEKVKVMIPRDFKWPFEKDSLKLTPENRIRELQKAGALIAAEIDRLQRLKEMKEEIYCFTFGQNHVHPLGGYPMKDFWIEVHGTFDEARQKMVNRFGDKWGFQYLKSEFDASYFPKGCHEVIN